MKRVLLGIVALVLAIAIGAGAWLYSIVQKPYKGYADAETFVEIAPGTSPQGMGRALAQGGVVQSPTGVSARGLDGRRRPPLAGR